MSPRLSELERDHGELAAVVRRLVGRIAFLEDRIDKTIRHGKVTDVDNEKHLARIEIGNKGGVSLKSPWVPFLQFGQTGDGYKFHNPIAVGQQCTMLSPNGEFRQAIILPFTWYDKAQSPSTSGDEHVVTFGELKDILKKQERTLSIGDAVSFDMTTDTITLKATTVVLECGDVRLGSKDATRQLALIGTVTTDGAANVSNLSTAVKAI